MAMPIARSQVSDIRDEHIGDVYCMELLLSLTAALSSVRRWLWSWCLYGGWDFWARPYLCLAVLHRDTRCTVVWFLCWLI